MGKLSIKVLGSPEVFHEGRAVKFRSRKVLALLLYLAVEGRMIAREKISSMFWPESDESSARATLRRTLADLRTALDDTPAHTHLRIERDTLGFAFTAGDELDIRVVDSAFDQLRTSLPVVEQGEARQILLRQLQQAVNLSHGTFMEGFALGEVPDFDDWISEKRAIWQRRMSLIYGRLAQMQAEQGEIAGAIETGGRWIAHDPLHEPAYQLLMRVYFASGDPVAALKIYEDCREVLAAELRVRPSAETRALVERIRHAGNRPAPFTEQAGKGTGLSPSLQKKNSSLASSFQSVFTMPMVGRAGEHLTLVKTYQEALQRQAQVTIVTGEAGIGKTRLMQEFLGWAEANGADILQARAFETGGRLPYQLLVDSLRPRLERENAPDDLLSDIWLAELARLFPELRERYPDLPPAADDELTARTRLYEAIVRLGQALAQKGPVVFFLDDLHWADVATLDVLYYAARRWRESHIPLLLLLSLRSENLVATSGLSGWLAGLEREVQAVRVHLDMLSLAEIQHLLETGSLKRGPDEQGSIEAFGRWLFAETHGQPLYVTETLKVLFERGLLVRIQGSDGQWYIDFTHSTLNEQFLRRFLPPGVREVIRVRLDQLTPEAFALLAAGAVLGRDFTYEQLCQVSALDEQVGLSALDMLLQGRFLREGSEREAVFDWPEVARLAATYFFTHDKIRDVVYSEAGEARRRVFHRRALKTLQNASAAERVQHAMAAGLYVQAFELYVAAGDEAMRIFAVDDAIAFYEQAQHLLVREPKQELLTIVNQLYSQLGRAYELTNKTQQAERIYQNMLDDAQRFHVAAMECAALSRMAILAVQSRLDFAGASALLRQALGRAEQVDDKALMADIEWHMAQLGFYDFDAPAIVAHSERSLELARDVGVTELMARSLNVLSYGKKQEGYWHEAERYAREAMELYRSTGNRAMEVDSMCVVANVLLNVGRTDEGVALAQTAYAISMEVGNVWGQVNSMYHLAVGALEREAYAEAAELAARCLALAQEFNLHVLQVSMYALSGMVQRKLHALEDACTTHQLAVKLGRQMESAALTALATCELCADYTLLERWDEATECAQQVASGKSNLFVMVFGLDRWYVTEALVRGGYIALATEDLERWKKRIEQSPRHRISYLRAVAVLARAQGQIEEAMLALQEALAIAQELRLEGEQRSIEAALQTR